MAYATYAQMKAVYGDSQMIAMTPFTTEETVAGRWEASLLGSSAIIDLNLRKQGYRLPLDLTGLADVAALLSRWCIALSAEEIAPALIAVPEGMKSAAREARSDLKDVAEGRLRLPLPILNETVIAIDGFFHRDLNDPLGPLDDRLFAALDSL